ncbi:COP9 signalosome subunit 5 [Carabus blaptoides fortunei]
MYSSQYTQQLRKVYLWADVYAIFLQHALSTEKEEVMGLLIGDVDEDNGISHISSCLILRRSDKQADRVEISAEQLMAATTYAEQLENRLQRPMRVVGWYHSHPHITVWPSRVDVGTQALYQSMDCYFSGLIFSVFPNETRNNENCAKTNEAQLTCFQSKGDAISRERREIPLFIRDSELREFNLNMMAELPRILRDEEEELASDNLNEIEEDLDPLIHFHNMAHKFTRMLHITAEISRPIYEVISAQELANQQRIDYYEDERERLLREVEQLGLNTEKITT